MVEILRIAAVLLAALLLLTPLVRVEYGLTLVALLSLIGMQAVYWIVTHPVNKVWAERERDRRASGHHGS